MLHHRTTDPGQRAEHIARHEDRVKGPPIYFDHAGALKIDFDGWLQRELGDYETTLREFAGADPD